MRLSGCVRDRRVRVAQLADVRLLKVVASDCFPSLHLESWIEPGIVHKFTQPRDVSRVGCRLKLLLGEQIADAAGLAALAVLGRVHLAVVVRAKVDGLGVTGGSGAGSGSMLVAWGRENVDALLAMRDLGHLVHNVFWMR